MRSQLLLNGVLLSALLLSGVAGDVRADTPYVCSPEEAERLVREGLAYWCNNVLYLIECVKCEEPYDTGASGISRVCVVNTQAALATASLVDTIYANHHHVATDYFLGEAGSLGCSSCGGQGRQGALASLRLERRHRYREAYRAGSFGVGVFCNYDIRLDFYRDPSGGNTVAYFNPSLLWPKKLVDGMDGDTPKDGVYTDRLNNAFKDLRLFNAAGGLTTNLNEARTAILETPDGVKTHFDVVDLGTENAPVPVAGADGWRQMDIGRVAMGGAASCEGGVFTVSASGRDIWNTSDECRYVFKALRGDGSITARVTGINQTDTWAKAGVMFRESLSEGSRFAFMCVTPGQGVSFQRRTVSYGSPASTTVAGIVAPQWVRLTRSGSTITGEVSADGTTWTTVGSASVTMGNDAFVGLAATSHRDGVFTTATVDNVTMGDTLTPEGEWPEMNLLHSRVGRVTKIVDRNGYATEITYRSFSVEEIAISPERQMQIEKVKDAYGREMTFTYHSVQESGNWECVVLLGRDREG